MEEPTALDVLRELIEALDNYNYVRSLYMCPRVTLALTEQRLSDARIAARKLVGTDGTD